MTNTPMAFHVLAKPTSYTASFGPIDPAMRRMCELLKQDQAPSEIVVLGIPGRPA